MNYIEEALHSNLFSDQLFYEEVLEQLEVEREFMISCLENNIILEAEAPASEKKGSWIQTIRDAIKKIFDKFVSVLEDLVKTDDAWIKSNIPKLQGLNYDGLSVNTLEYWKVQPGDINNILSELQKEINNVGPKDSRLKNLQTREQVEDFGAFKKYKKRNKNFTESIKIRFKVGDDNEPNPVPLSGDALKKQCIGEMSKYVVAYKATILPTLKTSYNNFNNMLNNVERKMNVTKSVKEAYCLIENAYYSDTELSLCSNYDKVFEADEQTNTTNKTTVTTTKSIEDNKPVMNKVQDTSKGNENKTDTSTGQNAKANTQDETTEYYTYLRNAIQLNQIALAAAMTACEEKYRAYMSILKGVVAARAKK